MNKVMRRGTCALLLLFALALCPIFAQQAFAKVAVDAYAVPAGVWVLEDDTVLDLSTDIALDSIVSDEFKLTIKGDRSLTLNSANGKAIDVADLTIADGLEIVAPEGAKVKGGTIVDGSGKAVAGVAIMAKAPEVVANDPVVVDDPAVAADDPIDPPLNVQDDHTHVFPLSHTDAKPATCGEPGNLEYWQCSECLKYFSDENATMEIADVVIPATGQHAFPLSHTAAKAATCTAPGNVEYWQCSQCRKYFSDENATTEIADVVIPATGHKNVDHFTKTNATCTEKGNIEYWHCKDCNAYFSDANLTKQISASQTVIAALGHNMKHTAAKAATCTKAGNIEYWRCSRCGGYFGDSAGKKTINKSDISIPKTGHKWGKWKVVKEATTTATGLKERVCQNNSKHKQTQEIPMLVAYKFTNGANSSWTKGSTSNLPFTLERNYDDDTTYSLFQSITVDGKAVESKYFDVEKATDKGNGLKLTLKQDYLKTLAAGNHKLVVKFQDGDAETTFTVKDSSGGTSGGSTSPATNDNIGFGIIAGIVLVALASMGAVLVARRRMS